MQIIRATLISAVALLAAVLGASAQSTLFFSGSSCPALYCAYTGSNTAPWLTAPNFGVQVSNHALWSDPTLPSPVPSIMFRCTDQTIEPGTVQANQSKSAGLGGGNKKWLINFNSTLAHINTSGGAGHITLFNPATLVCGDPTTHFVITANKNQTVLGGSSSAAYNFGGGSFHWTDIGAGAGNSIWFSPSSQDVPYSGVILRYVINQSNGNFTYATFADLTLGMPVRTSTAPAWAPGTPYAKGDYVSFTIPSIPDWDLTTHVAGDLIKPSVGNTAHCVFKLSTVGARGSQPTWSTGSTCSTGVPIKEVGGVQTYRNLGNDGTFVYQNISGAGTSGGSFTVSGHPDLLTTVSDNGMTWKNVGVLVIPVWNSFAGISKDGTRACSAYSSNSYGHGTTGSYDADNADQGTGNYVACYDASTNLYTLLNTVTGIQSTVSCGNSGVGYNCAGGTQSKLVMSGVYTVVTNNCQFPVHNAEGSSTLDYIEVADQGVYNSLTATCPVVTNGSNLLFDWQPFAAAAKVSANGPTVPPALFGAHYNQSSSIYPPPAPTFNAVRLWDTRTGWADLQTNANCTHTVTTGCSFGGLDTFLAKFTAVAPRPKIILTLGKTPNFIASNTADSNCGYQSAFGNPNGTCTPPTDVNCDGTGTDATWIQFVTALWDHLSATGNLGKIDYLEIWNEWNVPDFWDMSYINGTRCPSTPNAAQKILVRLEQDARCVLKTAGTTACNGGGTYPVKGAENAVQIMSSPLASPGANNTRLQTGGSEDAYLAAGGGTYADVLSIHGYIQNEAQGSPSCGSAPGNVGCQWPENIATMLTQFKSLAATYSLSNLPIFVSEGSWGSTTNTTDAQFEQAYMGRYLALMAQYGAANFNWYNVDDAGNPGTGNTTQLFANVSTGTLTSGGQAYQTMQTWLTGKTFSAATCTITAQPSCSGGAGSHTYECGLTTGEKLVWYDEVANNSSCAYTPSGFGWYRTIDGGSKAITGATITLDNRPILLEPFLQADFQAYNTVSNHQAMGNKVLYVLGANAVNAGFTSGVYGLVLDSTAPGAAAVTNWQVGAPFTNPCDIGWTANDVNPPCSFSAAYDSHLQIVNNLADDDKGVICGTIYDGATGHMIPVAPFQNEVICISMKPTWSVGSSILRYQVWRFAHSFQTLANPFFDGQYAIAESSPDGRFIFFTTDNDCGFGDFNGNATNNCGPLWTPDTFYSLGQFVNPFNTLTGSGTNFGVWKITVPGQSSHQAPNWPVCGAGNVNTIITDASGVQYTCVGPPTAKTEVMGLLLK
jgi:hypothetical protein